MSLNHINQIAADIQNEKAIARQTLRELLFKDGLTDEERDTLRAVMYILEITIEQLRRDAGIIGRVKQLRREIDNETGPEASAALRAAEVELKEYQQETAALIEERRQMTAKLQQEYDSRQSALVSAIRGKGGELSRLENEHWALLGTKSPRA